MESIKIYKDIQNKNILTKKIKKIFWYKFFVFNLTKVSFFDFT